MHGKNDHHCFTCSREHGDPPASAELLQCQFLCTGPPLNCNTIIYKARGDEVMTELPWDTSLQRVARAWRENMVRASTAFTPFTQVMLGLLHSHTTGACLAFVQLLDL